MPQDRNQTSSYRPLPRRLPVASRSHKQGASNQTVETTTGYLVVKETAVKVKMKDADKIGYTYNSASSDDPSPVKAR